MLKLEFVTHGYLHQQDIDGVYKQNELSVREASDIYLFTDTY